MRRAKLIAVEHRASLAVLIESQLAFREASLEYIDPGSLSAIILC